MLPELIQAKKYYTRALELNPSSISAKLPLIEILTWLDELDSAKSLCNDILTQTACQFDATLRKVFINIQKGDIEEALVDLDLMQKINPYSSILHRLKAMGLFQMGRIPEGWIAASASFNFSELKVRYPNLPRWNGEELANKTLVLTMLDIRGGGDEIMFASILERVIKKAKLCFIETELRAYDLFVQTFPGAIIFCKGQRPWEETNIKVDFHCWVRELAPQIFNDRDNFPKKSQFLKLTSKNSQVWENKIKKIKEQTYTVGICWRSLHSVGPNTPMCTDLNDWAPVFKIPNIDFINLHDLDGADEVGAAQKKFRIKIHSIAGADLRNKFDHVAGIAASCDAVITVPSTASIIARGIGANVFHLQSEFTALCMDILPWFPDQKLYSRRWNENWSKPIKKIAKNLDSELNSR